MGSIVACSALLGSCGIETLPPIGEKRQAIALPFVDGFETGTVWSDLPQAGWPAGSLWRGDWGTGTPNTGSYASAHSNHAYVSLNSPRLSVTGGQSYTGSVWARGEIDATTLPGSPGLFRAMWFDSAGTFIGWDNFASMTAGNLTTTWAEFTGTVSAPANATEVEIRLYFYMADGWIAYDDVSVAGLSVPDPGFEQGDVWTEYQFADWPAGSIWRGTWGSGTPRSGSYAMSLSNHAYVWLRSPRMDVVGGQAYTGSVWARGEIGAVSTPGSPGLFRAMWFDGSSTYIGHNDIAYMHPGNVSMNWAEYAGTVTAPAGAAKVELRLYFYMADGWIAYDDVSMTGLSVPDPGFEQGGSWTEHWDTSWPAGSIWRGTWGTGTPASGTYAVALSNHAYGSVESPPMDVTPGQSFDGSVWARGEIAATSMPGSPGLFRALWYDSAGTFIGYDNVANLGANNVTSSWAEFTGTVTAPAGAAQARLRLYFYMADGWIAYDDVSFDVSAGNPPPGPSCGNAVCDSGERCDTCAADCGTCPVAAPIINSLDDVLVSTKQIIGGASGYQLVGVVDVANVHKLPATSSDPYWWQYYRSFWEDDGTFQGHRIGSYYNIEFMGDPGLCDDLYGGLANFQTIAVHPGWSGYYCDTSTNWQLKTFYNTVTAAPNFVENSSSVYAYNYGGHLRRKITEGASEWIPVADSLGVSWWAVGAPSRVWTNFRIQLNEWIEFQPPTSTTTGAGYWREVKAGEVTPDGWGIVPAEPYVVTNGTQGVQWMFIMPAGADVMIYKQGSDTDPTACSYPNGVPIAGATPCIADPQLWMSSSRARVSELCARIGCDVNDYCAGACDDDDEKRAVATLELLNTTSFGGGVDPNIADYAAAGDYFVVYPDGQWSEVDLDEAAGLVNDGTVEVPLVNGSRNNRLMARANARATAVETGKPTLLIYFPQSIAYADSDTRRKLVASAIRDLSRRLNPGVVARWTCHSHSCHVLLDVLRFEHVNVRALYPGESVEAFAPGHTPGLQAQMYRDGLDALGSRVTLITGSDDPLPACGSAIPRECLGGLIPEHPDLAQIIASRSILWLELPGLGHSYRDLQQAMHQ